MKIKAPELANRIIDRTIKFYTPKQIEKAVGSGEPLVVLDNLVLSMNGYERIHPGGKFLLTRNYGRDISKFFYGGYAMVPETLPHTHTPAALKICEALVVGVV